MPEETQDGTAASSTATQTTDPLEAPLPEGTKAETAQRFKELLEDRKAAREKLSAYEQYGTPEQIAELQGQVAHLDTLNQKIQALEAKREPGEPKTDEQKKLEAMRSEARKEIRMIEPDLDKIAELVERVKALEWEREEMRGRLNQSADSATTAILKEGGYQATPDNVARWSRRLVPIIQDNPKLRDQFFGGDPAGAVKAAWDEYHEDSRQYHERKTKAQIQRDKEKLTGLPKPHGGGGGPGSGERAKPRSVSESHEIALEVLQGLKRS